MTTAIIIIILCVTFILLLIYNGFDSAQEQKYDPQDEEYQCMKRTYEYKHFNGDYIRNEDGNIRLFNYDDAKDYAYYNPDQLVKKLTDDRWYFAENYFKNQSKTI